MSFSRLPRALTESNEPCYELRKGQYRQLEKHIGMNCSMRIENVSYSRNKLVWFHCAMVVLAFVRVGSRGVVPT